MRSESLSVWHICLRWLTQHITGGNMQAEGWRLQGWAGHSHDLRIACLDRCYCLRVFREEEYEKEEKPEKEEYKK